MTKFLNLELADYVIERINENDDNSTLGIVENSLIFRKKKVNPFCIMFVDEITDKIYFTRLGNLSTHQEDYCLITTSDGNKFICKGSCSKILTMVEASMDTSWVPF